MLSNLKIEGGNAVEFKNMRFSIIDLKLCALMFICNRNEGQNAAEIFKIDFFSVCLTVDRHINVQV